MGPLAAVLEWGRRPMPGARRHLSVRYVERILRGVGQVIFQGNWVSGAVLLLAIGLHSRVFLAAALMGTFVATGTGIIAGMERRLLDAGMAGFNGCLVGIALALYLGDDANRPGAPSWRLWLVIVLAASASTVIAAAFEGLFARSGLPGLTAPFVVATWLVLAAAPRLGGLRTGPLLDDSALGAVTHDGGYSLRVVIEGTLCGVGQIFFQDSWRVGLVMLVAIALHSGAAALVAAAGALLSALVAMVFGGSAVAIAAGLYGFNGALVALALGGTFYALDRARAVYAGVAVVVVALAWPAVARALAPMGLPTLTSPFVAVSWIFLLARPHLGRMRES